MKTFSTGLAAILLGGCMLTATGAAADETVQPFRQTYRLDPEKVTSNAAKRAADLEKLPAAWKNAPFLYYAVPPLSDVPRLPDSHPEDGIAAGELQLMATPGEFEPASIVAVSSADANKFMLTPGALKSETGDVIAASNIDVKVVKVWYQAGSAWYGYFADALGRVLTPELLLNDENLVQVDCGTKDNYLRYANRDGSSSKHWASANYSVTNHAYDNQINMDLIADADSFQGAVLNGGEYKQFFITVHVPADAKEGVYSGSVAMTLDGKDAGAVPLTVRVLPFRLPEPKTNYDQSKGFYLCLYGTKTNNPAILKNLADHNAVTPMGFPYIDTLYPENLKRDIALAKAAGLPCRPVFSGSVGPGMTSEENPVGEEAVRLRLLKRQIAETGKLAKSVLGHTDFYGYAIDEGSAPVIRKERAAWRAAHEAGGKIMVTSRPYRELLFMLDFLIIPGAPADHRIREVNKFHESNPDSLCGWYADPHTGPENPNFFRRVHGYQSWKSNYDVSANYCWWRNNWNDMATPYEHGMRGLVMVYSGRDRIFDTIAWEGVREGMDDVKYVSYLKSLAIEAAKSEDGEIKILARRILSRLAYTDEERVSLDTFRLENVRDILRLRAALKKGTETK